MISIPAGSVVLRDEGTRTEWPVAVEEFCLSPYPVTRALYRAVRGAVPDGAKPDSAECGNTAEARAPVTEISWHDAVQFCNMLSVAAGRTPCYSMAGEPGIEPSWAPGSDPGSDPSADPDAERVLCDWEADGYRLPTEAEWEYACRAGDSGVRYGDLDEVGWYRGNSEGTVHEVGRKTPNAWGLHDMIGNVWEWCWDVYDPDVYGPYRVFRGGGWMDQPRGCRASCRRKSHPTLRVDDLGFRLAHSR